MVRAKNLLPDPKRFLKERFGFGVLAHSLVKLGQVLEADRGVEMFWPKDLLQDPERFLKERLGSGVLAHPLVQLGQVIEALRRIEMFRAQDLLPDLERFLKERLGFGVVPGLSEKKPEVIEGIGGHGFLQAPNAFCHFDGLFRSGNRLLIFSLFNVNLFGERRRACENPKANCRQHKR